MSIWDAWQWPLIALAFVVALFCLAVSCKGPQKRNEFRINPMYDRNYKRDK
jgi:hypothetical protein